MAGEVEKERDKRVISAVKYRRYVLLTTDKRKGAAAAVQYHEDCAEGMQETVDSSW